jgi:Protein of unknown function (DUF2442)
MLWFARLDTATPEQRARRELFPGGDAVHWPDVDEDISGAGRGGRLD